MTQPATEPTPAAVAAAPRPASFQSGILNRPPEHNLTVALRFTEAVGDSQVARGAIEALRVVVRNELRSDLDDQDANTAKQSPGPETGELGFADGYDRAFLTITLGLGKTAFDRIGVAPDQQPQDLLSIDWSKLGESPQLTSDQGDLALQICSDDLYVCEHVLRRIEEELGDRLAIVWTQVGTQRYTTRQGRTSRREGRALIGFLDGTSNLDPRNYEADRELVFVDPGNVPAYPLLPPAQPAGYQGTDAFPPDLRPPPAQEPAWTRNGSYMVVRSSAQQIESWDDQTLDVQEHTIGRFKFSGASLDLADEPALLNEEPAFASNQADVRVPVTAHVRKVNPRRPEDADRRIFRRGYPLMTAGASFQRGLLFICFGRSISTQFEFIWRAWVRNPNFPHQGAGIDQLLTFDQVLCGGYYFVPPVANRRQPWTWVLP